VSEKPRKGRSGVIFGVAVAALLVILGAEAVLFMGASGKNRTAAPGKITRLKEADEAINASAAAKIETFGDPEAKIQIEFYAPLPLAWHQKTIGLLRDYDKKHPGRIHVTLLPMGNSEADTKMEKRGFTCAVIMINGEYQFTLPDGREVELHRPVPPPSPKASEPEARPPYNCGGAGPSRAIIRIARHRVLSAGEWIPCFVHAC